MKMRVGLDAVDLERWNQAARSQLTAEVLTDGERDQSVTGQAAAFAIKEATVKCLETSVMVHDLRCCELVGSRLELSGSFLRRAHELGLDEWHASWCRVGHEVLAVVAMEGP